MMHRKFTARLAEVYQSLESLRRRLGMSYDQITWIVFAFFIGVGLFVSNWPQLTLYSGGLLLSLLLLATWAACYWQALQIALTGITLVFFLILFSGMVGEFYSVLLALSGGLQLAGFVMLMLLETTKARLSLQHIRLVYWLAFGSCLLLILLGWQNRPALGLHYAGIPMVNSNDSLLLLMASMLFMFIVFIRRHAQGNTNYLMAAPILLISLYVVYRAWTSASTPAELPSAVLEHGLLLIHVPLMILAFALFVMLGGFALLRLAGEFEYFSHRQNKDVQETVQLTLEGRLVSLAKHGVVLLGLGILSGMIWSSLAWGHYWHWEPKQLMSIVLWLYYLAALHFRLQKAMQGSHFAMLCLLGLPLLLVTLLGTYFGQDSLHNFDN